LRIFIPTPLGDEFECGADLNTPAAYAPCSLSNLAMILSEA